MSTFSVTGRAGQDESPDDLPIDEQKLEQALQVIAGEAEKTGDDDPRQAARMMRKLTRLTGLELGDGMQEALSRMENGEDPEKVEAEMGELLENEDPFQLGTKGAGGRRHRPAPRKDDTLYDL